jgi:hypothetical protein
MPPARGPGRTEWLARPRTAEVLQHAGAGEVRQDLEHDVRKRGRGAGGDGGAELGEASK